MSTNQSLMPVVRGNYIDYDTAFEEEIMMMRSVSPSLMSADGCGDGQSITSPSAVPTMTSVAAGVSGGMAANAGRQITHEMRQVPVVVNRPLIQAAVGEAYTALPPCYSERKSSGESC